MSFTFLGFLVFLVLATIKAARDDVKYSWFKACLPLIIGLSIDILLVIAILLIPFIIALLGVATSGGIPV